MNRELNPHNYHVRYGRHSNIPDCCIRFYLTEWQQHWFDETYRRRHLGRVSVGYVPCASCISNRTFIHVHTCDRLCRSYYRGDLKQAAFVELQEAA